MMNNQGAQNVMLIKQKNAGTAALLTFFFGPLGMFYSTTIGAIVMMILYPLIGITTVGLGLFILHPVAIIWAAISANSHNKKILGT